MWKWKKKNLIMQKRLRSPLKIYKYHHQVWWQITNNKSQTKNYILSELQFQRIKKADLFSSFAYYTCIDRWGDGLRGRGGTSWRRLVWESSWFIYLLACELVVISPCLPVKTPTRLNFDLLSPEVPACSVKTMNSCHPNNTSFQSPDLIKRNPNRN